VSQAFLGAVEILAGTMFGPLAISFLFLALWSLVRSKWVAFGIIVLTIGFIIGNQGGADAHAQISFPLGILQAAVWMLILMRFGVLSLVTVAFVSSLLDTFPITTDTSAWYAPSGAAALVIALAIGAYGFLLAIRGRPMRGIQS
jgi:hypothetical protein